jgi:molybdenum cofactor cytidylyltransferase
LLQHVVDAVAAAGPAATVVVLGHEADRVERAVDWQGATRVRNPDFADGLASSLHVGIRAIASVDPPLDGTFVCLGDQPTLKPSVLRLLATVTSGTDRPIVLPAYTGEAAGASNPALLRRTAWPLVEALSGDRGMGPVIAQHPELVHHVPVEGDNPDVDTPEDLRRL